MNNEWSVLTGQSREPLVAVGDNTYLLLHQAVLPHWYALAERASAAGFAVQIASAWRGFERQQMIWNNKASGLRAVLDAEGKPLDISQLSEEALLFAMLRWSAIPGCSRHHWGTDMDVFDASAVPSDYALQLTTEECVANGPFARFHCWLDTELQSSSSIFFRPYSKDTGGIAPERWHLSCRPIAQHYASLLDERRLLDWLMQQDIALKNVIRTHWHEIFHRYVKIDSAL